jgi:hypothetical protein
MMFKRDLACEIADNGGWEEFHQKRHNYVMFDYHKSRRLRLQAEYDRRFSSSRSTHHDDVSRR